MESISSKFAILEAGNIITASNGVLHFTRLFNELSTGDMVKEVICFRRRLTAVEVILKQCVR